MNAIWSVSNLKYLRGLRQ